MKFENKPRQLTEKVGLFRYIWEIYYKRLVEEEQDDDAKSKEKQHHHHDDDNENSHQWKLILPQIASFFYEKL